MVGPTPRLVSASAYTFIETMAAILVIMLMVTLASPMIMGFTELADEVQSEYTLQNLNKAIEMYRLMDGTKTAHSLYGPNSPQKIEAVFDHLWRGITIDNRRQSLVAKGRIIAASLDAAGEGGRFRFTSATRGSTDTDEP